jgi:DNA repair photolyase
MFVRWSNLTLDGTEQRLLPGYRDEAIVRHFDAPEALQTRFYEVRARSILNRVPAASRMPFRWTINPYRGCSHGCVYCLGPDTRVLRADGRSARIADLQVGDAICGTVRRGAHRRLVTTHVLETWSSIKPAYEVRLEDGTSILTSDDHRFLTSRGWKHVLGARAGRFQRPHLTLNSRLLGPGGDCQPPTVDVDYRRGYLRGMIRGEGNLPTYSHERPGRTCGEVQRLRLALAEDEALRRCSDFLLQFGVGSREFVVAAAAESHRAMGGIRAQEKADVERMGDILAWPLLPSISWIKGFLAGIFDAEGSCSAQALHISNGDASIIAWVKACLGRLGFDYAVEELSGRNGLVSVRVRGGLPERMRFFSTTDPAMTRKRAIEGASLNTSATLKVVAIRPLGMVMGMYDITTGTGDFIANGVVSHNCFARPTHNYLDFDAGRDFEREIVVKVNAPEMLRAELARSSWKREHVALGTNTDPYQWAEGRYRLMEGIWEAMRDAAGGAGNPCSVLTKSPLLLRDLPLMLQIAQRTQFSASLSIPTLDERAWRATEPHTPNPRARLEAVAEMSRAGIETGILIAPLMPGINDAPEQVEPLLAAAMEAGASSVGGIALHLRSGVKEVFLEWLRCARPDLVERYEELYRRRAYAPAQERRRLSAMVRGTGYTRAFRPVSAPREVEPAIVLRGEGQDAQQRLF